LILVDTSIWVDHFSQRDDDLEALIAWGQVLGHPFVTGELAVGNLSNWDDTVTMLRALPQAKMASEAEFLTLLANQKLAGSGLGFVDVHLLAACRLTPEARLWTKDRRLLAAVERIGLDWA